MLIQASIHACSFDFDEGYKQKKIIKFEDTLIPLVPLKKLMEMREKSNRPHDQANIFYLSSIRKPCVGS